MEPHDQRGYAGCEIELAMGGSRLHQFQHLLQPCGVKPVDANRQNLNADHAGIPENFKQFVIGGATGGGGTNYTGSLGPTRTVGPGPSNLSSSSTVKSEAAQCFSLNTPDSLETPASPYPHDAWSGRIMRGMS